MIFSNVNGKLINVWINELPVVKYSISYHIIRRLVASKPLIDEIRTAAVEYEQPTGGMAHYGLLGGTFIPADTDELSVLIPIATNNTTVLEWSLASRIDKVHPGLIEEFVESIMDEITLFSDLQAGKLHLNCAACGEIGSNQYIFRILTRNLLRLLMRLENDVTEYKIAELINSG